MFLFLSPIWTRSVVFHTRSSDSIQQLAAARPFELDESRTHIVYNDELKDTQSFLELDGMKLEPTPKMDINELVRFANKFDELPSDIESICTSLPTSLSLSDQLKSGAQSFIIFFTSDPSQLLKLDAISEIKYFRLFVSKDESLASKLATPFPGVYVYDSAQRIGFSSDFPSASESLLSLISIDAFSRITSPAMANYFKSLEQQLFYIIDKPENYMKCKTATADAISKLASKGKFVFFTPKEIQAFIDNVKLEDKDYPAIVHMNEESKKIVRSFKYDEFYNAINSIFDSTAETFRFISALPEDNESRIIKVENSDTILDSFKNISVDRMYFFNSPTCQYCRALLPVITEFAKIMKKNNIPIYIGEYNVFENEELEGYKITGVPALYYAKKGSEKMEEMQMKKRNMDELVELVLSMAESAKFNKDEVFAKETKEVAEETPKEGAEETPKEDVMDEEDEGFGDMDEDYDDEFDDEDEYEHVGHEHHVEHEHAEPEHQAKHEHADHGHAEREAL